jgi:hypothetical protein
MSQSYTIPVWEGEVIENNLQVAKQVMLNRLYDEGAISKEVYEDYIYNRAFIIRNPSFFHKMWGKLLGEDNDNLHLFLVKQFQMKKE